MFLFFIIYFEFIFSIPSEGLILITERSNPQNNGYYSIELYGEGDDKLGVDIGTYICFNLIPHYKKYRPGLLYGSIGASISTLGYSTIKFSIALPLN